MIDKILAQFTQCHVSGRWYKLILNIYLKYIFIYHYYTSYTLKHHTRGLAHQRVLVRLGYELELHVSAI